MKIEMKKRFKIRKNEFLFEQRTFNSVRRVCVCEAVVCELCANLTRIVGEHSIAYEFIGQVTATVLDNGLLLQLLVFMQIQAK